MPEHDSDTYRAALAAIERVRSVHLLSYTDTGKMCDYCEKPWPCLTIRALDGGDDA